MLENNDSPQKKALSIALGVFIGISPLWGFQTLTVFFLAYLLRLNKLIAFAFSNVSIPPFIPLIIFCSLKIGSLVLVKPMPDITDFSAEAIKNHIVIYLTGSILFAAIMAALFGLAGYFILISANRNKIRKNA